MTNPPNTLDSPTVWFRRLSRAKYMNDFEGAAEAVRQLRRLGVEVRFLPEHELYQDEKPETATAT